MKQLSGSLLLCSVLLAICGSSAAQFADFTGPGRLTGTSARARDAITIAMPTQSSGGTIAAFLQRHAGRTYSVRTPTSSSYHSQYAPQWTTLSITSSGVTLQHCYQNWFNQPWQSCTVTASSPYLSRAYAFMDLNSYSLRVSTTYDINAGSCQTGQQGSQVTTTYAWAEDVLLAGGSPGTSSVTTTFPNDSSQCAGL